MHTESTTTDIERFIARHRATIAVVLGASLALLVTLAWEIMAPLVFHIHAPSLAACVGAPSILGGITAALACYWGTE
jgi:hypothetical protein